MVSSSLPEWCLGEGSLGDNVVLLLHGTSIAESEWGVHNRTNEWTPNVDDGDARRGSFLLSQAEGLPRALVGRILTAIAVSDGSRLKLSRIELLRVFGVCKRVKGYS